MATLDSPGIATVPGMIFGSVCSGIEAASVAWEPLGWKAAWLSEIAQFPRTVLQHRYPNVPLHGDFTAIDPATVTPVDVLVGGTPCQSYSTNGKRRSLDDPRGRLTLAYVDLLHGLAARADRPLRYAVWENVPGVLSTDDNAFGCFIAGLVGADTPLVSSHKQGWWPNAGMVTGPRAKAAWRVLDSQFFGVPQRRERIYVVVGFGGRDPGTVLFEPGRHRDDAEKARRARRRGFDERHLADSGLHDLDRPLVAAAAEKAAGFWHSRPPAFSFNGSQGYVSDVAATLLAGDGPKIDVGVIQDGFPRRYTPVERERLQGFPDGWTDVAFDCTEIEHGDLRAEATGNSMSVPVIRWIGERIAAAH